MDKAVGYFFKFFRIFQCPYLLPPTRTITPFCFNSESARLIDLIDKPDSAAKFFCEKELLSKIDK